MSADEDIRALLPEPPPPAPKPRDAAFAKALARFDGDAPPVRQAHPAAAPWWKGFQTPQMRLAATVALVFAISLPFAWKTPVPVPPAERDAAPVATGSVPTTPGEAASSSRETTAVPVAISPAKPSPSEADSAGVVAPPARSGDADATAKQMEFAAAPAATAKSAAPEPAIVVQGRASPQSVQDSPVAVTVFSAEEMSDDTNGDIVVTSARRERSRPVDRGDWNACTVNDPRHDLSRCGKLAGMAAKKVRSEADARLAEGLRHAWDGDLDEAMTAFDAAIAVAPSLSAAYLNRGLVHDRRGDSEAALADLDRAVRLSPGSARAFYNRSVLLRKYGELRRADADERRAADLDASYQDLPR